MSKLRKIMLTSAALGALAVGGAAFAQAQNGSNVPATVHQGSNVATAGDTDPGQSADTDGPDRGEGASEQGSEAADGPESASENETSDANDAPDAHESNSADAAHEVEDGD